MNVERFKAGAFITFLVGALILCAALARPFWPALAWAFVLTILIYPFHRRVRARVKNDTLAAGISTFFTLALIVVPVAFVLVAAWSEGRAILTEANAALQSDEWRKWLPSAESGPLHGVWVWLQKNANLTPESLESVAQQALSRATGFLTKTAAGFFQNLLWAFVQSGLTLATLFFILKDGARLLPAVRAFIPLEETQTDDVLRRVVSALYATFYGVVLVALLQGALGGLGFWILGVPGPLLWGAVMFVLCLFPLVGAPVVWVPAALSLAAQGQWIKAAILVFWGVVVVGLADNVTRPFIIGGRTSLHPMAVFFAIIGGVFTMGGVGIFLGPVLLAVTLALLEILRLRLGGAPPLPGSTEPPLTHVIQEAALLPPADASETISDAVPRRKIRPAG